MRTLSNSALIAGLGAFMCVAPAPAPAIAQQQTPPPPACETSKFNDFDFWVGHWDVFGAADGQLQGTNRVEKVEKGCLIKEHWSNTQGGTGFSINYYDPVADQWRQVWVAGGYSIDYSGGLDDAGQMVLEGEIHYYGQGNKAPFRGTWTPNADGSVRQFFEQYNAEKNEWTTWFDGKYVRREE